MDLGYAVCLHVTRSAEGVTPQCQWGTGASGARQILAAQPMLYVRTATTCDAILTRSAPDEVQARVQLAQLVVAAAAVGDDLHARQRQRNVRRQRREQLLAGLSCQQRVVECKDAVAEGAAGLASGASSSGTAGGSGGGVGNERGQGVRLQRARLLPGGEIARLAVVAVVGQVQLGPDEQDLRGAKQMQCSLPTLLSRYACMEEYCRGRDEAWYR